MKNLPRIAFCAALAAAVLAQSAGAQVRTSQARSSGRGSSRRARQGGWQVAGSNVAAYAGGRYHSRSSVLPDLPFSTGDFSWALGIEFHESGAYWQFLVGGMRSPGEGEDDIRYVLTPEINLVIKDRAFIGGVGILKSYVRPEQGDADWSRIYYQFLLGFDFTLGDRVALRALASYPFAQWGRLRDFKGSDLEYTAGISFRF